MGWVITFFVWAIRLVGIGAAVAEREFQNGRKVLYAPSRLEVLENAEEVVKVKKKKKQMSLAGGIVITIILDFVCFGVFIALAAIPGGSGLVIGGIIVFVFFLYRFLGWLDRREATAKIRNAPLKSLSLDTAAVYTIKLPRATEQDLNRAHRFMEQLVDTFGQMTFRIVATHEGIEWQIIEGRYGLDWQVLVKAIRAVYPQAQVEVNSLISPPFSKPIYRYTTKFTQRYVYPVPISNVSDLRNFDPVASIVNAMSELEDGERVVYTLFVAGYAHGASEIGQELITQSNTNPFSYGSVGGVLSAEQARMSGADRAPRYVPELQRDMEIKLSRDLFNVLLTMQVDTPLQERLTILASIALQVQFSKDRFNAVVIYPDKQKADTFIVAAEEAQDTDVMERLDDWLTNQDESWKQFFMVLDIAELAALWHLPSNDFSSPSIAWVSGTSVPLPRVLVGKRDGVCIGDGYYADRSEPVYMRYQDRDTHVAIVGMTGTGKTTLMHHLIHQDIATGKGVAVVDPQGKLVDRILESSIPPERENDVWLLDVAEENYPPPLNLLAAPEGVEERISGGQILAVLEKFGSFEDTVSVMPTLRAAVMTLFKEDTPTVRDVARLFYSDKYRQRLLQAVENPATQDFWMRFQGMKDGQRDLLRNPVMQRIEDFYANMLLYPIMCHPDTLDFSSLVTQGKIILVSLKADERKLPPQEQHLLGAVLISQLQMAAMAGAAEARGFYLYIDEVQNFVTTSLDVMLSQARQRGLSLTLANQYLAQLAGNTLDALLGTVGALVVFECGHVDARPFSNYMKPGFDAEDLVHLGKYNAAVYMRNKEERLPAFGLRTRKPFQDMKPPDDPFELEEWRDRRQEAEGRALRVREKALNKLKTRAEILEWLAKRYPFKADGQPGDDVQFYDE